MRTQKHKILSIIVLNMAKYTIISLILIDFVPIFFIFNLFQRIFRGSFSFKKSQVKKSPKLILGGGRGQPISIKSQVQKSPNPARGGSSPLWTNSQVSLLFRMESFPSSHVCFTIEYKNLISSNFGLICVLKKNMQNQYFPRFCQESECHIRHALNMKVRKQGTQFFAKASHLFNPTSVASGVDTKSYQGLYRHF